MSYIQYVGSNKFISNTFSTIFGSLPYHDIWQHLLRLVTIISRVFDPKNEYLRAAIADIVTV